MGALPACIQCMAGGREGGEAGVGAVTFGAEGIWWRGRCKWAGDERERERGGGEASWPVMHVCMHVCMYDMYV